MQVAYRAEMLSETVEAGVPAAPLRCPAFSMILAGLLDSSTHKG
jgi:hypothetical protein